MFGINTISWSEFLTFLIIVLLLWYTLLVFYCRFKSKQTFGEVHFENAHSEILPGEGLQPIAVSSKDFPSAILSLTPVEDLPVYASLYEETGYDEGLSVELFSWKNSPVLAKMIDDFHYQH